MYDFVKQYIKLINYSIIGIVFAFASFYLLTNAYHYLEVRKTFDVPVKDEVVVKQLDQKVVSINSSLATFNQNTYQGKISTTRMMVIYQNLKVCSEKLQNETIKSIKNKTSIDIRDVYKLRESYENEVVGGCVVPNLMWITEVTEATIPDETLLANSKIIKLYIDRLRSESTMYLKKDLLNNSSYFFNTGISTSSIKNNTKDGFYEVINSYNDAATLVNYVADWFQGIALEKGVE